MPYGSLAAAAGQSEDGARIRAQSQRAPGCRRQQADHPALGGREGAHGFEKAEVFEQGVVQNTDLLDYRTLQLVPLSDALNALSDKCSPWIQKLNLHSLFDRLHHIIHKGSSAERQLKRWDGTKNSLIDIVQQYKTETLAL